LTRGEWLYLLGMALAEIEDAKAAADDGATKRFVATRRKHKPNTSKRPRP
jgi:hypothetical protein